MTTERCTEQVRQLVGLHGRLPAGVATVGVDDDLFQAGMTSHASVNVMLAVEELFDFEFPEAMLRKSTFASIRSIADAVAQLTSPSEVPA